MSQAQVFRDLIVDNLAMVLKVSDYVYDFGGEHVRNTC